MMHKGNSDRAVSPVIGVILLVALTVALVALAATVVFDISSDTGNAGAAAVDYDPGAETLTVVDMGTADHIELSDASLYEDDEEVDSVDSVGSYDISPEDSGEDFDVIMEVDGDKQLYGSFETNEE